MSIKQPLFLIFPLRYSSPFPVYSRSKALHIRSAWVQGYVALPYADARDMLPWRSARGLGLPCFCGPYIGLALFGQDAVLSSQQF